MSKGSSTPLTSEDPTQSLIPAPSELLPKSHLLCSPLAIPCSTFALFQGTAMLGISHKAPHKQIFPVRPAAGPEAHTVPFHLPVQRCYALLKTNLSTSLLQPFLPASSKRKKQKKKPQTNSWKPGSKETNCLCFFTLTLAVGVKSIKVQLVYPPTTWYCDQRRWRETFCSPILNSFAQNEPTILHTAKEVVPFKMQRDWVLLRHITHMFTAKITCKIKALHLLQGPVQLPGK